MARMPGSVMSVNVFRSTLILIAKHMLFAALQGMQYGRLQFIDPSSGPEKGPCQPDVIVGSGEPSATVLVKDDWFWVRVLASGSVVRGMPPNRDFGAILIYSLVKGFAEAYISGEIDSPNLLTIFKVSICK